jgi:hypothetical protein
VVLPEVNRDVIYSIAGIGVPRPDPFKDCMLSPLPHPPYAHAVKFNLPTLNNPWGLGPVFPEREPGQNFIFTQYVPP